MSPPWLVASVRTGQLNCTITLAPSASIISATQYHHSRVSSGNVHRDPTATGAWREVLRCTSYSGRGRRYTPLSIGPPLGRTHLDGQLQQAPFTVPLTVPVATPADLSLDIAPRYWHGRMHHHPSAVDTVSRKHVLRASYDESRCMQPPLPPSDQVAYVSCAAGD
jgi:hypothetical protein